MQYIVMVLAILGVVLNIFKRPESYVIWTFTNGFWIYHNYRIGETVQMILFAVMAAVSIYGAVAWYMEKMEKRFISEMRQFELATEFTEDTEKKRK